MREWQPSQVFLPGEFHGQRSQVGCSPWGCKESDTTEQLTLNIHILYFLKKPYNKRIKWLIQIMHSWSAHKIYSPQFGDPHQGFMCSVMSNSLRPFVLQPTTSSDCGIFQVSVLKWVAISSSYTRNRTHASCGLLHCGQITYLLSHKTLQYCMCCSGNSVRCELKYPQVCIHW